MRVVEIVFLVVAGLLLIVYPALMLANVMGVASMQQSNSGMIVSFLAGSFYLSTTLYPVIYIYAVVRYVQHSRKKNLAKARKSVWLPYIALAFMFVLFILFVTLEDTGL